MTRFDDELCKRGEYALTPLARELRADAIKPPGGAFDIDKLMEAFRERTSRVKLSELAQGGDWRERGDDATRNLVIERGVNSWRDTDRA